MGLDVRSPAPPVLRRAQTASEDAARQTQPSEPILLPKLRIPFCRLPLPTLFHSTRGCSPRRPAAVMGTTGCESTVQTCPPSDFQGPSGAHRTPPQVWRYAGHVETLSPANPIPGERLRREEKTTLPGTPAGVSEFGCVAAAGHEGRLRTPGSGMLTRFPFGARHLRRSSGTLGRNPAHRERRVHLSGEWGRLLPSLRIDSPVSNCCSHGTLLHFGLQGPPLNTCYYHQDPHRRPLHLRSRSRLHSQSQKGGPPRPPTTRRHTCRACPAGVGKLGVRRFSAIHFQG